ncbi:MAG: Hsp20/alpha crystallin family protein [Deltaproteobacteria bacterium]|nr:Hsp20/alpha crystallin family protein [Deltaproteobacteria bacterium]MBW1870918.1 Hsp20/alpha crystallin family protein [Deltaproteobacteria bacterium]
MTEKEKKELEVSKKKPIESAEGESTREGITYVPDVDIFEDSDAITLRTDLPGAKKENLTIDIDDGTLTLSAAVDPLPKHFNTIYKEYEHGGYSRRFSLGERIDQEKISAKLENGVLTLVLSKSEAAKPRKIEIS